MVNPATAVELLVALGIGGLIGMERERAESGGRFAGSRTLPLVALLGALVQRYLPDLMVAAFLSFMVLVTVAYLGKVLLERDIGLTTSVATILTFVFGAMATQGEQGLTYAVVFGVITTSLLAAKEPIHGFADRIGRREMADTLKFLILALVVLPLLPNREMDLLLGLNPRFVWLMVVFVSGISYSAYLLTKLLGTERGIGATGVLGGIVSSTATAVSMAERAKAEPGVTGIAGVAIVIASMAMLPRILIEVSVVNPELLPVVAPPIVAMAVAGVAVALIAFRRYRAGGSEIEEVELDNPFRLKPALLFGAFFALILIVSREGSAAFGDVGVYVTAVLSGVADVDAITLSLSRLSGQGSVSNEAAAIGIVLAAVTNTVVKLGIAVAMGTMRLGRAVAPAMLVAAAVGLGTALAM